MSNICQGQHHISAGLRKTIPRHCCLFKGNENKPLCFFTEMTVYNKLYEWLCKISLQEVKWRAESWVTKQSCHKQTFLDGSKTCENTSIMENFHFNQRTEMYSSPLQLAVVPDQVPLAWHSLMLVPWSSKPGWHRTPHAASKWWLQTFCTKKPFSGGDNTGQYTTARQEKNTVNSKLQHGTHTFIYQKSIHQKLWV